MQVFYSFAPFILALLGVLVGLTAYYFDMAYRITYEWVLWPGISMTLAIAGLIIGRLIQKLSRSTYTDFSTGLWNRRYFYLRLKEEKARADRKIAPLCVAMIDVDEFKTVNDTFGHSVGDELLSKLAVIFKEKTRATDVVTRWGGDEFAIIFSETSLEQTLCIMERVRQTVQETFAYYQMTISAGIILLEREQDLKELLIKADQALYKAKTQKNSIMAVVDL